MTLIKRILTTVMLAWAIAAQAQAPVQQVDITADQLLGGNADEQLQALGARAASEALGIIITAPAYWREMVEEQVRIGAGNPEHSVIFRETMVESVIVRLVDESGEAPQANAKAADSGPVGPAPEVPQIEASELDNSAEALKAQARASISSQSAPVLETERPRFESTITPIKTAPVSLGETAFESADEGAAHVTQMTSAEPPNAVAPAPAPETPAVAVGKSEKPAASPRTSPDQDADEARASLEKRLNNDRPITRDMKVSQLRLDDQLFTSGELIAVVRRSKAGYNAYWLRGELDFEQSAIREIQPGKYLVLRRVKGSDGAEEIGPEPEPPAMAVLGLDSKSAERSEMEARYNQGDPVETALTLDELRVDDVLYVGESLTMVIRRNRVSLKRFWLAGDLDLERPELEKLGSGKYRLKRNLR